ncbi:MAG: SoxR reducing system RseC family protein [Prevotella sp.]|jgi:sigma-E factor negative regulatory protein RseC|nr:SoxR reducing system RseC family protein [Prevotella sp.]MCI1281776.1 SoxR reducing system RseC family protein [Prevotella sp.]
MTNRIKHRGRIDSIEKGHVKVRIFQTSACSSCRAKGFCNASESKEKVIDVYNFEGDCHVGDDVTVSADTSVGYFSVMLGFGVPLLLMIAVVFCVSLISENEAFGALMGVGILVPYYFILWLLRDKIGKKISFKIDNE